MIKENYKGEFDEYEVPSNIWGNVEAELNKDERKKRALIWWKVAGVLVVVIGVGALFTSNYMDFDEKQFAKNESVIAPTNSEKENEKKDEKEVENPVVNEEVTPISDGTIDIEYTVEEKPSDQLELNAITTAVPFVTINPSARSGAMAPTYDWSAPIKLNVTGKIGEKLLFTSRRPNTQNVNVGNQPIANSSYGFSNGYVNLGNVSEDVLPDSRKSFENGLPADQNGFMKYRTVTPEENISRLNYKIAVNNYVDGDTDGVLDGIYIQEHIPTKKVIPYEQLREAEYNDLWLGDYEHGNSSTYDAFVENDYLKPTEEPLSTFSIDVDGASYSDIRGMINRGQLPNKNSVRIEEFVNYFPYSYEEPVGEHPFSMHSEIGVCPWNLEHKLLKIGIKGKSIEKAQLPKNNLVFLLDVSGSMDNPEKLELLKKGFRLLVKELREEDRVAICVYAGAAGLVLPSTSGANKDQILDALNKLSAGGSTAGGQGIELAYAMAEKNFKEDGNNRVILATDGDFNVGVSGDNALVKLIEEKRKSGVFLTVLGFGHDNFQSSKMEKLANNGNGNFSFIDNILEAKKVLVTEMGATLQAIAKDVKIQVEFNPELVSSYRLIGYENRLLQNEDFSNDTIDAGELGAGHTVTAIYEIIPAKETSKAQTSETDLKYSQVSLEANGLFKDELATMKFRYKKPDGETSILIEQIIKSSSTEQSGDFQFVQAVVEFGLILRDSKYAGTANFDGVLMNARGAMGEDPFGYRNEFILLVEKAKLLSKNNIDW